MPWQRKAGRQHLLVLFATTEEKHLSEVVHPNILFENLQIVGKAEKESVDRLLSWSSTLAQRQTQSSAVSMGVDAKMLFSGGISFFCSSVTKGRENSWNSLSSQGGNESFWLFSFRTIAVLTVSNNFLKWQEPAELDEGSCLV